ncbi:hypothetical protein FALBO_1106 [Fusarium albosuccineum]|uniref:Uncharacterized protein n=1 Tax=Fusarium albosuccineum TaxID=1237068 RepID=A0A8H4PDW6_9HYPO|nr:hypothetical protein FALBO_1106 [Fusarium albosuccineum]
MGGNVFTHEDPPLETPRMPKEVYQEVKSRVLNGLRAHFRAVYTPVEGPGKETFGDIDCAVSQPKKPFGSNDEIIHRIRLALGATAVKVAKGAPEPSAHFAIPWPRHLPYPPELEAAKETTQIDPSSLAGPSNLPRPPTLDSPSPLASPPTVVGPSTLPRPSTLASPTAAVGPSTPAGHSTSAKSPISSTAQKVTRPSTSSNHSDSSSELQFPTLDFNKPSGKPEQPDWPLTPEFQTDLSIKKTRRSSVSKQEGDAARNVTPYPNEFGQSPDPLYAERQLIDSRRSSKTLPLLNTLKAKDRSLPYLTGPSRSFSVKVQPVQETSNDSGNSPSQPCLHIQVDVHVFDTMNRLEYTLFHQAHGDFFQLVGSIVKPYGLTIDDQALWLRIPEIETVNRKLSKVKLTEKPDQILKFLGFPPQRFWSGPFENLEAMYEYVAQCRFFWVAPESTVDDECRAITSNDRRRLRTRPGYRQWVEEFKPRCREQGRFAKEPMTREEVKALAFTWFDVQAAYENQRLGFLKEQQKLHIQKDVIGTVVPASQDRPENRGVLYRSNLVKALKEIILDGDRSYGVYAPLTLRDSDGFFDIERVRSFIERYKGRIGDEAMERSHKGMVKSMKGKRFPSS